MESLPRRVEAVIAVKGGQTSLKLICESRQVSEYFWKYSVFRSLQGQSETGRSALGTDSSNGPNSSIGPSLHALSTEVPSQPLVASTNAATGHSASLQKASSGHQSGRHTSHLARGCRLGPVKHRQLVKDSLVGWSAVHAVKGFGGYWWIRLEPALQKFLPHLDCAMSPRQTAWSHPSPCAEDLNRGGAAYSYLWRLFELWCKAKQVDPLRCGSRVITLYLQEHIDRGKAV